MKINSGVSLISLTITIVIIIILAGVTIYYGINKNIDTTSEVLNYTEVFDVSEAVSQRALMNRIDPDKYKLIGTPVTSTEKGYVEIDEHRYTDGWYSLTKAEANELNLEGIKGDYIVNYDTGEVVSKKPLYLDNKTLYVASEIKEVIGGGSSIVSPDMYDSLRGVNKPYMISGMIPVKNINGKWIVTNANDPNWYDYSAGKSAWANVMLLDEITISGYTNDEVRKASLSSLEGREVTNSGSMFVWIPRFTINSANKVTYSYLLTDYTDGYTLPSVFTHGTTELTGIWISKYDAEYKY